MFPVFVFLCFLSLSVSFVPFSLHSNNDFCVIHERSFSLSQYLDCRGLGQSTFE